MQQASSFVCSWTQFREFMSRLCGSRSGRQGGLRKVLGVTRKLTVSEELEMTQTLTELMDPVFVLLGINFQYFLRRKITMKAIEHSLCECIFGFIGVEPGETPEEP